MNLYYNARVKFLIYAGGELSTRNHSVYNFIYLYVGKILLCNTFIVLLIMGEKGNVQKITTGALRKLCDF